MIALLYARLSADDRDGGMSGSVARQLAESEDRALAAGDTIGGRYVDDGVSGAQLHRPGIDALLEACRPGCRVWAKNQSRLGRDVDHVGYYRVKIREAGAELVCWAEEGQSRIERGVRGIVDEQHVIRCREEAARILPARARAGQRNGGSPPAGYLPSGDGWILDPEAAAPTVRAYRMVAAGATILEAAAAAGIPGPTLAWRLRNPLYAGGARWGSIVTWGAAPAAIDRETWDQVQAALDRRRKQRGGRRRKGPLSGLLLCGACGARLRVVTGFRAREGWVDCYGCRACRAIGAISTRGWIPAITATLAAHMDDVWIERQARAAVALAEAGYDRGVAEAEVRRLARSRDRLLDALTEAPDVRSIAGRLRETEAALGQAEAALAALPAPVTVAAVRETLRRMRAESAAPGWLARVIESATVATDRSVVDLRLAGRPTRGERREIVAWAIPRRAA